STLHAYAGGRPVIDARRGEVFTSGPALARPEELEVRGLRLIGDGAVRYRERFEAAGAEIPPDDDPAHQPSARLLVDHADSFGAVEPDYQRRGIATRLLERLFELTSDDDGRGYTLEVRVSNREAIKLYEKLGFERHGIRRGYYTDNREDALIMWRDAESE